MFPSPPKRKASRDPPLIKEVLEDRSFILRTLRQLWLSGVKIDWDRLHTDRASRTSLPTYPFERQRYWIESNSTKLATATAKESNPNNWFYIPSWSRVPLPKINSAELARQDRWLIFQDELGLGESLKEKLISLGHQVITVTQGEVFKVIDRASYGIKPDNHEQLLEYLNERDFIPEQIIYLWKISRGQRLSPKKRSNFESLLNLVRTLDKQQLSNSIQLNVIFDDLHDIIGTENIDLEKVSIKGITKIINQEYPYINCRLIDTDILQTQSDINYLLSEISRKYRIHLAYRNNRRWQEIYQFRTLDSDRYRLKQQGKYLIFGSITQDLGLVFAKYLIEQFQAQLVLIGETDRLDIDCLTIEVDINNKQAVSKAIARKESSLGKLDGVFYSTPMTNRKSASIIADFNFNHWEYNYQTKINPLQILTECLNEKELDFV